ncbi:hypothetical protein BgAZ_206660 [Babesia gibsoni]|uniref:Transmembrane protein n=1 Tax=Babesia gibsoni TaxID=33632 RepID=A0AAD8PEC8_BABGI|nr:hypothetical protein BgAZ_206660 [Babesia gibsoni]
MNQRVEKGRVFSANPDNLENVFVHGCDVHCVLTGVFYTFVCFCASVVFVKFVCETFHYRMCPWIKSMADREHRWVLQLGAFLVGQKYVDVALGATMAELTKVTTVATTVVPALGPYLRVVAEKNTRETWVMAIAFVTVYLVFYVVREFCVTIAHYLHERHLLFFCVNMKPVHEANSRLFTKKMLRLLYNSPEYRRLKQIRQAHGPAAWNWQTRQRMGEPMPSDEMSDEEM